MQVYVVFLHNICTSFPISLTSVFPFRLFNVCTILGKRILTVNMQSIILLEQSLSVIIIMLEVLIALFQMMISQYNNIPYVISFWSTLCHRKNLKTRLFSLSGLFIACTIFRNLILKVNMQCTILVEQILYVPIIVLEKTHPT